MIAALLAFAVSALLVAGIARHPGLAPQDRPNHRSLHDGAVPRAGGWAVFAGWAVALALAPPPPGFPPPAWGTLLGAVAALFAVSLADDLRGLAPGWRLAVHAVAALALAASLDAWPGGGAAGIAAVALVLIAATNFFNFMDGSDGLAGAMALCGFAAYAAAAALAGAPFAAWLALAAAIVPFLARNWPPARLFLGDAGSVPLGFLAAAAGIAGAAAGTWPGWFPVVVFLPFLADATVTLLSRALRGERVWEAHRTHYYQRLVRQGAGHRGALALYGALMAGCAASAVACAALAPGAGWALLAGWSAIVVVVFARIDYHGGHRG